MFTKILIANRGEIACRIIKTARRMGIATVAVYSDADRRALHVSLADEALPIGPAPAADSYLSIDAIIEACRKTGADAVHPGYGFLSESAGFCRALTDHGIVFIGPHAQAIEAMGDKIAAKNFARASRVAVVPGSESVVTDTGAAVSIAEAIGYPVMIKASAGGGGKGMRIAASSPEVVEVFASAASEAKSAFGDDRIFIEKFIQNPRHIEVQILGDKHGHVVHLGERECSIQRRHQKVIEEAPSSFVDTEMRAAMGAQAIALARAVRYDSAGTVEFVVSPDKSFYFLEMNTRLQVEHAVTECVTGIDIVEQMIRVAAGEPLSFEQDNILFNGHAVEARIYAENPQRDFLPSTGRLTRFRPPPEQASATSALRIDSGVIEGSEISIHYDPMLAKLITYASDRVSAIAAQSDVLDRFVIDGIDHNLLFLAAVMGHPKWKAGDFSTNFIKHAFPQGFEPLSPDGDMTTEIVCVAASIDYVVDTRAWKISGQMPRDIQEKELSIFLDEQRFDVRVARQENNLTIHFAEQALSRQCQFNWIPGRLLWEGAVDGHQLIIQIRPDLDRYLLSTHGIEIKARILTRRAAELAACLPKKRIQSGSKLLLCPMPGLVKFIYVAAGQTVAAGDTLCMIEAMKMEHILRAEFGGVVKEIYAKAGELIGVDKPIMEFV